MLSLSSKRSNLLSDNNAVILRVSLKPTANATDVLPIGKIRSPAGLAISPNGAWIVAAAGHKVYVARTSDLASGFTKYVSPERLTCLAFHPSDEYFATGDEKGVVRLWYCLNNDLAINSRGVEKRTQTTSLHWHAHAVSSVTFTPNGAYLLSGGEEAVLVIWQVHTGKKEFIPRLGAPINAVSVSSRGTAEEYLVRLADSTHSFISSSSLRITRSYSQIRVGQLEVFIYHVTTHAHIRSLNMLSAFSTNFCPSGGAFFLVNPYSSHFTPIFNPNILPIFLHINVGVRGIAFKPRFKTR